MNICYKKAQIHRKYLNLCLKIMKICVRKENYSLSASLINVRTFLLKSAASSSSSNEMCIR